jgi:hypothetical protein
MGLPAPTSASTPSDPPASPSRNPALDGPSFGTSDFPVDELLSEKELARRARAAARKPVGSVVISMTRLTRAQAVAAVLALVFLGVGGAAYAVRSTAIQSGIVRVESDPPRASVQVDGTARGMAPVSIGLPVGRHTVTVSSGPRRKSVVVDITADTTVVHHVDLPIVVAPPATPGPPTVVEPARTAPVVARAVAEPGPAAGWLHAMTPVPLMIAEAGAIVGTTEADRVMMPSGDHTLEFSSAALGYRSTQRVHIDGGKVATVTMRLPTAPVQINALPWADVWIDGQRVGETPLANVMQPIGPHEIVFRHPELGERRVTTLVTLTAPARATVDMRTR